MPPVLACALSMGWAAHAAPISTETISVYEFGKEKISSNDTPVLVPVDEQTTLSVRPTFELTESFVLNGAHQLRMVITEPVAVLFGDWYVPSGSGTILTFTAGAGDRIENGTYVGSPNDLNSPQLTLSRTYPAFSHGEDGGPWFAGETSFSIESLQRDAAGQIQSFSATFSSKFLNYWRAPWEPGMTGRLLYNMPSAVPEADAVALLLSGLTAVGLLSRRQKRHLAS